VNVISEKFAFDGPRQHHLANATWLQTVMGSAGFMIAVRYRVTAYAW